MGTGALAPAGPKLREAHGGAELEGPHLPLARRREGVREARFGFRHGSPTARADQQSPAPVQLRQPEVLVARIEAGRRRPPILPLILTVGEGQTVPEAMAEQPEIAASWIDADARLPRLVIA